MPWVSEVVTAASVFRFQKQATGTRCELFFPPQKKRPFLSLPRRWVCELSRGSVVAAVKNKGVCDLLASAC